jgi:hypothetical protein
MGTPDMEAVIESTIFRVEGVRRVRHGTVERWHIIGLDEAITQGIAAVRATLLRWELAWRRVYGLSSPWVYREE